jgi:putative flippase GtrA
MRACSRLPSLRDLGFMRVVLFPILTAASATWALNRRYTFRSSSGNGALTEWARFVVSQLPGATVNLTVYGVSVYFSPFVAKFPIIGVALGSIAGMLINFVAARAYAFKLR